MRPKVMKTREIFLSVKGVVGRAPVMLNQYVKSAALMLTRVLEERVADLA
jgi:hypothetical protein